MDIDASGYITGIGAYTFPEETFSTYEVATPALQWSKEGKLQQQWQICELSNIFVKPPTERFEWRDVPVEG